MDTEVGCHNWGEPFYQESSAQPVVLIAKTSLLAKDACAVNSTAAKLLVLSSRFSLSHGYREYSNV